MIYSDVDIKNAIDKGEIVIDPFDPDMIQPSSIDVHLDKYFRTFEKHQYTAIDPSEQQDKLTRLIEIKPDEPFILQPNEFILGSTYEKVQLGAGVASRLEGKSSLGRLGIMTHSTAGFIDPGFSGHVTLELSNMSNLPVMLWPGMKIGQLCFFETKTPCEKPYGQGAKDSRYQDQVGPTPSRSYKNFNVWSV